MPPTGTVTFLFTDLEGHTRLWEEDPEATRRALAWHDMLVRAAIEGEGGYVVKTTGDGFHAAFSSAASGLAAAITALRALAGEQWPTPRPLRARMALHTGTAELRGDDYFGSAVNRAARLMATGHGGQLLLSASTHELLRDAPVLPEGAAFRGLGEHRLGDLQRPERIYQLVLPDLSSDFPPIRTLDNRPNNLPPQVTALIGREHQIRVACERLYRPDVRLLTLTGPGGTGKTRLALQVAAELLTESFGDTKGFAHGVFVAWLAAITDAGLVLSAVAQALGLRETIGLELRATLFEYLRQREVLLVLDNFEQLLAGAEDLAELMAACPRVKVLVTSRQPLHLYGEHEMAVPPLALPDAETVLAPADALAFEAVRLFVERAQSVDPDFRLNHDSVGPVVGICQRLDGLPLAIELAAARLKLLSPQMLLSRLESRLTLLTGGARDRPVRQQTLRDTIAWSYELLTESEQRLFRRLAVFRGGWTLEAAEAICGDEEVLDELASLVDQSLVERRQQPDGDARFTLLETVREYGLERLAERGGLDELRRRHAEHFCAWAEMLDAEVRGPRAAEMFERFEQDHDNCRAALEWALGGPPGLAGRPRDADLALRLAGALAWFCHGRGHLAEGREAIDAALRKSAGPCPSRLRALLGAGWLAHIQEDRDAACVLLDEAITIADQLGDAQAKAWALNVLGRAHYAVGDLGPARARAEESLALAEAGGSEWVAGWVHGLIGRLETLEGNYPAARAAIQRSLEIRRRIGDVEGIGVARGLLAYVEIAEGNWAAAVEVARESLRTLAPLKHPWILGLTLETLATAEGGLGRAERCVRLAAAAHRRRETMRLYVITDLRAARDRLLGSLRTTMGDALFEATWERGRAMTPDQAVEYALAEPEPMKALADHLSAREREVAALVGRGMTNRQIAEALVISERTADRHVANILAKLGFRARAQVAGWLVSNA